VERGLYDSEGLSKILKAAVDPSRRMFDVATANPAGCRGCRRSLTRQVRKGFVSRCVELETRRRYWWNVDLLMAFTIPKVCRRF
jgi:hypothetical protein